VLKPGEADAYTDGYLLGRAARATYESFPGRFLFGHTVGADEAGFLTRVEGGVLRRYGQVANDLFRDIDGPGLLAVERDADGTVVALHAADVFNGIRYPASYERLARWEEPYVMNELLSWTAGLPVLALLAWGMAALALGLRRILGRGRKGTTTMPHPRPAWEGLALAIATLAGILIFGFGFMAKFNAMAMKTPEVLAYGLPNALSRLLWMPWAIAACTLALVAATTLTWTRSPSVRLIDRLFMSVVSACALVFTALLISFHMLPPVG
jgi:hypothetical protein